MRDSRGPSASLEVTAATLAMLAIGFVDYATGIELRVFPLYFLPVLGVAVRLGKGPGIGAALLAAVTWLVSNELAGLALRGTALSIANTLVMAVAFVSVALLGAAQQRSLERERKDSRTDSLTGLLNGRGFYEGATTELVRARRYHHPITLAFLDLDDFKAINDRFGHAHGDAMLARVGEAIRASTRRTDVVGRLGGDEFALLLTETDRSAAESALRKLIAGLSRIQADDSTPVTASIGSVSYAEPPAQIEVLLHAADQLMYETKAAGKNSLRCEARSDGG